MHGTRARGVAERGQGNGGKTVIYDGNLVAGNAFPADSAVKVDTRSHSVAQYFGTGATTRVPQRLGRSFWASQLKSLSRARASETLGARAP